MERVGVLTGGGDCPGLNAVIRGVVRKAFKNNIKVVGIKNGWKGLVTTDVIDLDLNATTGILPKGGTILGTSRTNPYKNPGDVAKVIDSYKKLKLDALIAIGGEDTLGVANKLCKGEVSDPARVVAPTKVNLGISSFIDLADGPCPIKISI